jgi:hypothetical protein
MENTDNAVNETNETGADNTSNSANILNTLIPDEPKVGEGDTPAGGAVAVYEVPDATVTNLTGLLSLVGFGFAFKGYANAAAVWAEDNVRELAIKLVPVFAKYSWGQRFITFLNTGGGIEEMALFPVALSMITATYQAMMQDKAAIADAANKADTVEPGKTYTADSPLGSTFKHES